MNEPDPQFRVVLRGYEPNEVDRVISKLKRRIASAEAAANATVETETSTSSEVDEVIAGLMQRVEQAERNAADLESSLQQALAAPAPLVLPKEPPSFAHLGERVGEILVLAEDEARELRERANADAEETRKLAEGAALAVRDQADQYAEHRRRDADAEADRILADARRAADEERDSAERDAATRRQEGEAVFEQQRADAAKAAADFETTLAERRERSAAEFRAQQAANQAQLEALADQLEEARAAAQREQEASEAQSRRILLEAEERAASLVQGARASAERIRQDSDRELAAATQRRDSINAQLSNVRQMLATLSGSAAGFPAGQLSVDLGDLDDIDLDDEGDATPLGEVHELQIDDPPSVVEGEVVGHDEGHDEGQVEQDGEGDAEGQVEAEAEVGAEHDGQHDGEHHDSEQQA